MTRGSWLWQARNARVVKKPTTDGMVGPKSWMLIRLPPIARIEAVGESFHQSALIQITGRKKWVEVLHECDAVLVLEPENPYDHNAVRVEINAMPVGHLPRAVANDYAPFLRGLAAKNSRATCESVIAGRARGSETRNMGVFLHMPSSSDEASELLAETLSAGRLSS